MIGEFRFGGSRLSEKHMLHIGLYGAQAPPTCIFALIL
jgi:hypothetical protein